MKTNLLNLKILFIIISLTAFTAFAFGGYLYYSIVIDYSKEEAHRLAENYLKDLAETIDKNLEWHILSVKSLSGLNEIKNSLSEKKMDLYKAEKVLIHFRKSLKVKNTYIINKKGTTIADSNEGSQISFVGENYGFRTYFKDSIRGLSSVYMGIGKTSMERGIYYSYPVFVDNKQLPSAIVVIKASIEFIENELKKNEQGIIVMTDPNNVIFLSNRKEILFKYLWKMPEGIKQQVLKSRQFGNKHLEWSGVKIEKDTAYDKLNNSYRIHKAPLNNNPGWNLVFLHNNEYIYETITKPIQKSIGLGVLISCCFFGFIVFYLFKKANRNLLQRKIAEKKLLIEKDKLEKALSQVKELSGLLPICSSCKNIRDDKGYWKQIEIFIQENSSAEFSHGICPKCSDKIYGDEEWYKEMKKKKINK